MLPIAFLAIYGALNALISSLKKYSIIAQILFVLSIISIVVLLIVNKHYQNMYDKSFPKYMPKLWSILHPLIIPVDNDILNNLSLDKIIHPSGSEFKLENFDDKKWPEHIGVLSG